MARTNLIRNPSAEVDLVNYSPAFGTSGAYWRDTGSHYQASGTGDVASLRVNNATAQQNGPIVETPTLASGTYVIAMYLQQAVTNNDSAIVVRRQSDGLLLFEGHYDASNPWLRFGGFFSVSTSTPVDIIVGVGIYATAITGSTRFDQMLLERVGNAGISTAGMTLDQFPYFDGSTPDTDATIYAWTGTAHNSTSTATDNAGGTPGDTFQSWNLEYSDTFDVNGAPNSTHWYAQDGYRGTAGNGFRVGSLAVVTNGKLELRANGDNISGINSKDPQLYGKWDMWMYKDPREGYSPATFLWSALPGDPWWPGENDIWEGSSNTSISSFMHFAAPSASGPPNPPTPEKQLGPKVTPVNTTVLHKYSIEWLPDSVTYLLDDVVFWRVTDSRVIPSTPMKIVIQLEVKLPNGSGTASGTVRPNYPAPYNPVWKHTIERIDIYSASTSTNHNIAGQAIETLPVVGPGAPGAVIDTANAAVEHFATGTDQGTSNDTASGTVPGQGTDPGTPVPPVVELKDYDQWIVVSKTTGKQLNLTDFIDNVAMMRGSSGLYGPPSRIRRDIVPGQPGAVTRDITHDVRKIGLPLAAHMADLNKVQRLVGEMVRIMDPVNNEAILRFIAKDGHVSELTFQAVKGLEGESIGEWGPHAQEFSLGFDAEDPYWYRETITQGFRGGVAKGWFPILPLQTGASAILGEIVIVTNSDVPVQPVWTLVGPLKNPALVNKRTNKTLSATLEIFETQNVVIDTRARGPKAYTVTGPNGENWFSKLNKTGRSFWSLQPGRNEISMSVVGSTPETYISVAYRNATYTP